MSLKWDKFVGGLWALKWALFVGAEVGVAPC